MVESKESIGIAGSGRVARALGRLLASAGEPVDCVVSRDQQHAADAAAFIGPGVRAAGYTDLPSSVRRLIVAVPDHAITGVAAMLSGHKGLRLALHTCGTHGPEALAPLQRAGIACGTLHPLQTVSGDLQGVAALHGIAYGVWGDRAAVEWAEQIAGLAHGEVLRIAAEFRPLYHAAAVMSGNYVIALLDAAQTLMGQCGIDSRAASRAIGPLVRTSVANALARGPVCALTGPIERGDVATVTSHLAALTAEPEHIRNLYRAAGLQTVHLASRRGLDPERAQALEHLLAKG